MYNESIIYGYIRDIPGRYAGLDGSGRMATNRSVLHNLPAHHEGTLVYKEMFAQFVGSGSGDSESSSLIHFGACGNGVEYEWKHWMQEFEALLAGMYWFNVTVHLETELAGKHTFCWDAEAEFHTPSRSDLCVRCEWSREGALA